MTPERAVLTVWGLWLVSWMAAAFWTDRTALRPGLREQALYRVFVFTGGFLVFVGFHPWFHPRFRLWDLDPIAKWLLVAVAVLGFAFAWWARLHLGRLWSSSVTRKVDHHVVDTGPYALVRHPIYTGLIAASFATAAIRGIPAAVIGAILMALGFMIKARLEERFLREQLGPDAYDAYRRRTPMLIPFGPK